MQARRFSLIFRSVAGSIAGMIAWAVSAAVFARDSVFAWVLVPVMGPIAVAAEYPSIPSVDDNGVILLVQLFTVVILFPWAD